MPEDELDMLEGYGPIDLPPVVPSAPPPNAAARTDQALPQNGYPPERYATQDAGQQPPRRADVPQGRADGPRGLGGTPKGRAEVPRGRDGAPQGRAEVPQGRDSVPRGYDDAPRGRDDGLGAQKARGVGPTAPDAPPNCALAEPNYLLRTQLLLCLFLAGVLYFAWRQGGPLWVDLARSLRRMLEEGISFSGQEELTRFTDEVRDFFGNLVEALAPLT